MTNRVYTFLEKYTLLNEYQYGFRKKRYTTLAVFKYIQEVINCLEHKKYAVGLLLDMTKAYDKVSHRILLRKLFDSGIRGNAYSWLKSYLKDRHQFVQLQCRDEGTNTVNNIESDTRVTNWSIPQGSVLGCILFLVYINDLPDIIDPNSRCIMFADDVSILSMCSSVTDSDLLIHENLINTQKYLEANNLEINLKKTKLIQFRPHQKQALNLKSLSNSIKIEEVNEFTLLGICIDTHLNWKSHVQNLGAKLSRFIYALSILKANTNYETALSAYYAYAFSWIRYGIILWGESTNAEDIFILQKKCIRILVNIKPRESCRPHFFNKKILTLPSIYIMETAIFVRKHLYLYKTVEDTKKDGRSRRHKNKLVYPSYKLKMAGNGPLFRSIKIYNKIPKSITEEKNEIAFKRKLKQWLTLNCFYEINELFKT